MLLSAFTGPGLERKLVSTEEFCPFPSGTDRGFWEGLTGDLRQELVQRGERDLHRQWPPLLATQYMEFMRSGACDDYDHALHEKRRALGTLIIAECVEWRGRFLDDIVNGVFSLCEESTWVGPQHYWRRSLPDAEEKELDLRAAEAGAFLAWTHYLLRKPLGTYSEEIYKRIRLETDRRITELFVRYEYWWMGFGEKNNNWNPWITSNVLTVLLMLTEDPVLRRQGVRKCLTTLNNFVSSYDQDGGCDEGPGYWDRAAGSLLDSLELLHAGTSGWIDVFSDPLVKEMGRYINRAYINNPWFMNFGDCPAQLESQEPALIFRYGARIGDDEMRSLGAHLYRSAKDPLKQKLWFPMYRMLTTLQYHEQLSTRRVDPPLIGDVWLNGIQVMVSREHEGDTEGLYVAAKGGHNGQNHNHNDTGHYILYLNGSPVVIDTGTEAYRRETFNEDRYKIWTMRSLYHNLPEVNGCEQPPGADFGAANVHYESDGNTSTVQLNIAGSYPPEARIGSLVRRISMARRRPAQVSIRDSYRFHGAGNHVVMNLMLAREPKKQTDHDFALYSIAGDVVRLTITEEVSNVEVQPMEITDEKLRDIWGSSVFRLRFFAVGLSEQWEFGQTFEVPDSIG